MRRGTVNLEGIQFVPDDVFPQIRQYCISRHDLYISVAGTLGLVGGVPEELDGANLTENANRISGIQAPKEYLYQVLASPLVQSVVESERTVGAQPKLALVRIRNFSIPLPPEREEQLAIGQALTDADTLIDSLEQLLTKQSQIKQGAMQELLTGKRRLPGLTAPWQRGPLGKLLSIKHGRSQREVQSENGAYPILASGGVIGRANAFLHDQPSVLIGRKGTIDAPRYMDTPFWSVDTLFYSHVAAPNSAKFLYYRFCLIDWMQHNEASGVPSLSARVIEAIEVNHPDSAEQHAIAQVLTDMDTAITALQARLTKARDLKQALMQVLLTGRIRLLPPAPAST
jgi:type I restriction enzyme S subunit